jgi:hypothetical protein
MDGHVVPRLVDQLLVDMNAAHDDAFPPQVIFDPVQGGDQPAYPIRRHDLGREVLEGDNLHEMSNNVLGRVWTLERSKGLIYYEKGEVGGDCRGYGGKVEKCG